MGAFFSQLPGQQQSPYYLGYPRPSSFSSSSGGTTPTIIAIVGMVLIGIVGFAFFNYVRRSQGLPEVSLFGSSTAASPANDKAPEPIDGKTRTVLPASELATAVGDYGLQFWMYIRDWDYRFGQPKHILKRQGTNGIVNPSITLHPTDNTLQITVSIYPNDDTAGAAVPGAGTTGDSYTCSVENVPLQSWFSVSVTVFQRNLDVYLNGRLVKSCVLPGIPKPAAGDIVLADEGGFSGTICNIFTFANMLTPDDANSFFGRGTQCQAPAPPLEQSAAAVDKNSLAMKLFGSTFRFARLNKDGQELSSYTL